MPKTNEHLNRKQLPIVKRTKTIFYIFGITFVGCYGSYAGVVSLQSSMNVEEGLGTKSVMITYITSSISGVLFVPYMIDFLGAKSSIILGEIGFLAYIVANYYPSWYTLIPAAIFHGLMASAPWVGSTSYVTFLGKRQWVQRQNRSNSSKSKQSYLYGFFSLFSGMISLGEMFGTGVVGLVLLTFQNADRQTFSKDHTSNEAIFFTNTTLATTTLSHTADEILLAACGSNDCPVSYAYNATDEELDKFIPNPISIYSLITFFAALCLVSIIIQIICLPRAPAKFDQTQNREICFDIEYVQNESGQEQTTKIPTIMEIQKELRDYFWHLVSPLHLLVMWLFVYFGMFYAFVITDYTRAFISCTIGVEKIGIIICIANASGIMASVLGKKVFPLIGRRWLAVVMGIFHMSYYILTLLWKPDQSSIWILYLLAILIGVCYCTIDTFKNILVVVFFEGKEGIAFALRSTLTNIGIAIVTGWSINICVFTKLYVQLGVLSVSLVLLAAAELVYRKFYTPKR